MIRDARCVRSPDQRVSDSGSRLTPHVSRIEDVLCLPVGDESARGEDDRIDAQWCFCVRHRLIGERRESGRDATRQEEDENVEDPAAQCLAGR